MKLARLALLSLVAVFLASAPFMAYADDQPDNYISYTYAEGQAGLMSLKNTVPTGTGGSSSETDTITMLGGDGSYGFDKLFDAGKYFDAQGAVLAGAGTVGGSTLSLGIFSAGVGAHAEFHPTLGAISGFITAEEQSTAVSTSGFSSTSSSSLIVYGIKWMILDSYEWDFYGTSQGGSSSSSSSSPVGGNSLNLQLTWIQHPNKPSYYFGGQYRHQSQSGSSSDTLFVVGGYRW